MLTLDWSLAERMALVEGLGEGLAVMRHEGCVLELLPDCRIPDGRYEYTPLPYLWYPVTLGSDPAERVANLPRLASAHEGSSPPSEVSAEIAAIGRYRAMPLDVRRAPRVGACEGATHVVSSVDVGTIASDTATVASRSIPEDCFDSYPSSEAPPPDCREPWSVLLFALDPLVPLEPSCPAPLHWNGLYCDHDPTLRRTEICTLAPPSHSACYAGWDRGLPLALPDAPQALLPEHLTSAMVDAAIARVQGEIDRCGERAGRARGTRVRLRMHVDGPAGRVIDAQAIGHQASTPLGHCAARVAVDVRFETTRAPSQTISPTWVTG